MIDHMLKTREEYISLIKNELLGPGSEISIPDKEHELISSSPQVRYSMGILFPRDNPLNADNDDPSKREQVREAEEDADDFSDETPVENSYSESEQYYEPEEDNLDEEIGMATQNMPSSLGITFFINGNADSVNCTLEFGTYRSAKAADCKIPFFPDHPENYSVPGAVSHLVYYDKDSGCLKLIAGKGISRKDVSQIREKDLPDANDPKLFDAMYKLCAQLQSGYVREPHKVRLTLSFEKEDYIDNNQKIDGTCAKVTALRRNIGEHLFAITVMLVNDREGKPSGETCIFQPILSISTDDNEFVFAEYSGISDFSVLSEEEQSLELQYRNKRVFATGLGTSTSWDIDAQGKGTICNDFFPEVEVPGMEFNLPAWTNVDSKALSMKFLSDIDQTEKSIKVKMLRSVIEAYNRWIDLQFEKSEQLDPKFKPIAKINLDGCKRSVQRMFEGLELLEQNETAWKAFQLANRAMYMQRVHLKIQAMTSDKERFPDDEELSDLISDIDYRSIDQTVKDRYAWRPFQIAFLLMSLNSVSKDDCKDRDIVDLIWFPTGGGKTEAYLGLTAYTIFFRRMAHAQNAGGTTVMMRYTLRLLAAQQFTRASTLICACEYIRRKAQGRNPEFGKYDLGNEPISIGLWIGGEHTPNTNDRAKSELKYLIQANAKDLRDAKDRHNKFQVLKCPWCGTKMVKEVKDGKPVGMFGYQMRANRHFELFCPQESCYFNEVGTLPIQIVDQELYSNPPTLLFGTVDKFAMMPWKKEIGSFFASNSANRTPELIIQDELHLISGPLGTMVGLYETAIDKLCAGKGTKSKIVASTATIRRAKEQCAALYDREVVQFPHPGIDAEDSFFAREATIDYSENKFGRKYIGLMPSGKTKAMMEIRSIAGLLQTINAMDLPDEIKDKYWTLTVYFNSLKDLGKCDSLVDDDVKDFIKRIAFRLGTAKDARMIAKADELTSRVSTTQLNETLDKLEKQTYSQENIKERRFASNVLLATNMISVGIDVARLNVMLLVGQPKLTSEYIQASSRIGRQYPGMAFVIYDGAKSRDRSHYEQFKPYHESFYKYVEPTGATPFSGPARERALHAVLIALLRQINSDLADEKQAGAFSREKYADEIAEIKSLIIKRSRDITLRINPDMKDESPEIYREIDEFLENWENAAKTFGSDCFSYGERYMEKHPEAEQGRLMKAFNTDPNDRSAIDTMTSMRNVDTMVAGNVLIWEDE